MYILGIHNSGLLSSAALVQDGRLVAACPEERLDRKKMSRGFPGRAIQYCLDSQGISLDEVDATAVGWNPGVNVASRYRGGFSERVAYAGEWLYAVPNHLLPDLGERELVATEERFLSQSGDVSIYYVTHHDAHAACAFFMSPFEEAAVFTADAYGERHSTTWKFARGTQIQTLQTMDFPQSIGSLYAAFTEFLGFTPHYDEWKVMGLAAYGDPAVSYPKFERFVRLMEDGRFELDLTYFNHYNFDTAGLVSPKMVGLFGPPRQADAKLAQWHSDIAAGLQRMTEGLLFHCVGHLYDATECDKICLSGGAIMNSVFNGVIKERSRFREVYIPFAPDDSGNSIGAALYVYHCLMGHVGPDGAVLDSYFGPEWTDESIEAVLNRYKLPYQRSDRVEAHTACLLARGKIGGWFQGRSEFGQRALGNRSILADPRDVKMKELINSAVKYREDFRPFAPSILEERASEYFDLGDDRVSFMEKVYPAKACVWRQIPAVVHEDGSSRVHTVSARTNLRFYRLIEEFDKLTGVPLLLNTSFNLKGEPIVCSPEDALRTFFTSGLDFLVLGSFIVSKA